MTLTKKQLNWFKLIILVLILLLIGFLIGYYFEDRSCIEEPLIYGIEKMNQKDGVDYTCTCHGSILGGDRYYFYFNENGFIKESEYIT